MYAYDAADRARRVAEPPKRAGAASGASTRGDFQRDRARVLHSYAFRRLADKTQVVVPGEDDFPRTRLTHSLEVAQIGREIGDALGCDADVVDTAGLAHDIGHPPFGHNGEDALDAAAASCGGFEGNAQTLRVLTRLEAKAVHPSGEPAGLNLTRAVLDATCKYPWQRRSGTRKFGCYAADIDAFRWMRSGRGDGGGGVRGDCRDLDGGVGGGGLDGRGDPDERGDTEGRSGLADERRCLEAQVMDWADDVAYSVHDVEDGVHAGLIRLAGVDEQVRETLCRVASELYSPLAPAALAPVLDELLDLPTLRDLAAYDATFAAQVAGKRATSELTGRFAGAAIAATRAEYGDGPLGRYGAELVVPSGIVAECALLKAVAAHFVMSRPGALERQAWQRQVLTELVEVVCAGAPATLDPASITAWRRAGDDAERQRVVIDQIAQLTDSTALAWHERLVRP